MFETFNVPALHIVTSAQLCLYASGTCPLLISLRLSPSVGSEFKTSFASCIPPKALPSPSSFVYNHFF